MPMGRAVMTLLLETVHALCLGLRPTSSFAMQVHLIAAQPRRRQEVSDALLGAIRTHAQRAADMEPQIKEFMFVIPRVCCSTQANA